MNLFIDTNIYLSFFNFSDDDIEELKKLITAIENKAIKLYITQQIIHEFIRNRENKLSESIKFLKSCSIPSKFPRVCHNFQEYTELKTQVLSAQRTLDKLIGKLEGESKNKTLSADSLIKNLFEKSITLPVDSDVLRVARERREFGNPPGKNDSLGDAVNWECLMNHFPNKKPLFIITSDGDYISKIDENSLKEFLLTEWKNRKKSEIKHYKSLTKFFKDNFPSINLATELEKQLAIEALINSFSFRGTHDAITKLNNFIGSFTSEEINQLISGAYQNPQVFSIRCDDDVERFFQELISGKEGVVSPENLQVMREWNISPSRQAPVPDEALDDCPF